MPTKGTLTFAPGDREQSFGVVLMEDDLYESTVEFGVQLSNPGGPGAARVVLLFCSPDAFQ